jgi:aminomethyltransferase
MAERTPLYERHLAAGARMVDFGGWDMPLHYGSQIDEHHAVRSSHGVFDVSHMTVVDAAGPDAGAYLQHLLANNVAKLDGPGRGLYSCMLNARGGVVDDLIVYRVGADAYRLVVNAATRAKDLAWLEGDAADFEVTLHEVPGAVMLAVQGPSARAVAGPCLPQALAPAAAALKPFRCAADGAWFVARTGYTGEDGWEIIVDDAAAGRQLWDALLAAGVQPCGLGARDTLRLEAGLPLYGQDMDEDVSPLAAGLGWTVAWDPADRNFTGRDALAAERARGPALLAVGLVLEDRGIMRHGQSVLTSGGPGVVTSGGFSPTLQRSIALARVPAGTAGTCDVDIRGQARRARVVKPPFVRHGQVQVPLPE